MVLLPVKNKTDVRETFHKLEHVISQNVMNSNKTGTCAKPIEP